MILRSTIAQRLPRVISSNSTTTSRHVSNRQFSLWPSSDPSSESPSSSDVLPPSTFSPPTKPSLSDFLPPAVVPDPTYLEPLSTIFLSLPPTLSLSYAAFIPLFTILYRTATTLPVVLWQRRRTRRFAELVIPRLKKEQGELALKTRDECRRLGKSYEEYQKVFQKRVRSKITLETHTLSLSLSLFPSFVVSKKTEPVAFFFRMTG